MKKFWLFKTEPGTFSIDDLAHEKRSHWEGVRNYQARNFIRDQMRAGDEVLIYHSGLKPPVVAGWARIVRPAYPDCTAWDKDSPYFDKKSTADNPVWFMVDVEFVSKFPTPVTLDQIKADPELSQMMVAWRGMRLSIQPVERAHFEKIVALGRGKR
jgi:predicted RNA-binding protein with PUA-like domain